jgi:AcrR family transcriptional regulator
VAPSKSSEPGGGSARARRSLVENEIYEQATKLFTERGFASTTLQDIADALGVTRPAIYYYFKSKEAILARLVQDITQEAAADLQETATRTDLTPPERLEALARLTATRIASRSDRFQLLVKSESELPDELARAHREARREVLAAFRHVVEEGVHGGEFRQIDPRMGALGVLGICTWVAWWRRPDDDVGQVADVLAGMAVASLRSSEARRPGAPGTLGAIELLREDVDRLERLVRSSEAEDDAR